MAPSRLIMGRKPAQNEALPRDSAIQVSMTGHSGISDSERFQRLRSSELIFLSSGYSIRAV